MDMIRHNDISEQLKLMFLAGSIQVSNEQVFCAAILQARQMTVTTESDETSCSGVVVMSEFGHDMNDKSMVCRAQGRCVPTVRSHSKLWATGGFFNTPLQSCHPSDNKHHGCRMLISICPFWTSTTISSASTL